MTLRNCPIHGWTLIQKFRSEQHQHNTLLHPIDEWWCRSCGYDNPVGEPPPADAVDPQVSSTGTLSTRDKSSKSSGVGWMRGEAGE